MSRMIALVEIRHRPISEAVKVLHSFGTERIHVAGMTAREAYMSAPEGEVTVLEAEPADFRKWLNDLAVDGIWTSTNPMLGTWTFHERSE